MPGKLDSLAEKEYGAIRILQYRGTIYNLQSPGMELYFVHSARLNVRNSALPIAMRRIRYRLATLDDAVLLAPLNQQLIRDEGHRNPMNLRQLTERMAGWLAGEYQAVLFEDSTETIGYALFRRDPDFVYLRQLFVVPERRRQGVARNALQWLWRNAWKDAPRLRIEVLVENVAGRRFWQSVGLQEYAITMEAYPSSTS